MGLQQILDSLPSDTAIAIRHALFLEREAQRIAEEALIAGAFPQDFKTVHLMGMRMPWRTVLG